MYCVVFIMAPMDSANDIAEHLVNKRLAACVNIIDGVRSIYWWKGKVEEASESLLIVKTRLEILDKVKDAVREIHPYEVPEIIALKIADGLKEYLEWIDENVKRTSDIASKT